MNQAVVQLPARRRHRTRETSIEALKRITRDADTLRGKVYRFLLGQGEDGATDEEIQESLGMPVQTETARRNELTEAGLVTVSGFERKSSYGRWAIVWIAVR